MLELTVKRMVNYSTESHSEFASLQGEARENQLQKKEKGKKV
jgi:hypothetical protein